MPSSSGNDGRKESCYSCERRIDAPPISLFSCLSLGNVRAADRPYASAIVDRAEGSGEDRLW